MPPPTPAPALQVFYDGACPLCSREMRRYMRRDPHHRIDWIDIAQPTFHPADFGLDPDRVQKIMHARTPDGTLHTQVHAFVKIWEALPPTPVTTLLRALLKIPGLMPLANLLYRLFARNRYTLTGRCTPQRCDLPPQ